MYLVLQTPSLQHLAGVKVVAHLWSQRDIFAQIAQSCNQFDVDYLKEGTSTNEWKTIEEKVINKISTLPLPNLCTKQLFNVVKPLGMEVLAWCGYHCKDKINFQFLDFTLPNQLCWSMHGTVDFANTAELMLKDERVSVEKRYQLACVNCLEDEARELFQSMNEEQRRECVDEARLYTNNSNHHDHYHRLTDIFTCTLSDDVVLQKYFQSISSNWAFHLIQSIFLFRISRGNGAMFEFLFEKLDPRQKDYVLHFSSVIIAGLACTSSSLSVLFFVSRMNNEHRELMLRKGVHFLLDSFLRWPLQPLFSAVAKCGWQSMDINDNDRTRVLRAIVSKISRGFRDYDYPRLFLDCWHLSTAESKRFYYDFENVGRLIETKEEELIKLVLNEAPSPQLLSLCHIDNRRVLMDESVISLDVLKEFKEEASLISFNDKEDEEKRLRSQHLTKLVNMLKKDRIKRRRKLNRV